MTEQASREEFAFVFPGQGSQKPGMGREIVESYRDTAGKIFATADAILGFSISDLCFKGTEAELAQTEITQPALFTISVAVLAVLQSRGYHPIASAGHSVGEYAALVAAGAITFEDALPVVRRRGELMAEANQATPGAMAAVLGLSSDSVYDICARTSAEGVVEPSNINAPSQIVISGETEAVLAAMERAKAAGGKAIRLKVGAPFHSRLMEPVRQGLERALAELPCVDPLIPVIANATGDYVHTTGEIRSALLDQVAKPVLWTATIERFRDDGIASFLELGPGRILGGLIKLINPSATTRSIATPDEIDALEGQTRAGPA